MQLLKFLGLGGKGVGLQTPVFLFNTLSQKKDAFTPIRDKEVRMYNCGPTVYDYPHIGNFRSWIFADILRRTLEYNGYRVKQVINITDVGHLTSDADVGEDKVERRARLEGKKVSDIVEQATEAFFEDLKLLNVRTKGTIFPRASDHIKEQIAFVQTLEEKGYTYRIDDGVYFDTSLFKNYGKLGNIQLAGQKEGARVEGNPQKRHAADFALWKFSPKDTKRQQEWESPWGIGFPGWHLECSAMAMKHLGKELDIHTGGIDHIPIHHNNEIAQTESVTGRKFARYWLHGAFITIDGQKISKSVGNTIYVRNIMDHGYSPLSLRYWFLTGHYKSQMNFTWEALEGAHVALFKLHKFFVEELPKRGGSIIPSYEKRFREAVDNDLDMPKAVALLWELVRDENVEKKDKRATLLSFDEVLGIGLSESNRRLLDLIAGKERRLSVSELPSEVWKLVDEREDARVSEDFGKADALRTKIELLGFTVSDTPKGPEVRRLSKLSTG